MDGTRGTRAPHVVGQRVLGIDDLPGGLNLISQLFEHLNDLPRTRGSERVAFGFQASAGVDRDVALVEATPAPSWPKPPVPANCSHR
jgi:hypothetical protein